MHGKIINPYLERDRKSPKTGNWYIFWTEQGKGSRERSTRTKDRKAADLIFAEWKIRNYSRGDALPCSEVLITDVIAKYLTRLGDVAEKDATKKAGFERAQYAAIPLTKYWEGRFVSEIDEESCEEFVQWRQSANETIRRDLGVLRAAINKSVGKLLTSNVEVYLPPKEEGRTRFLTFREAKALLRAIQNRPKSGEHLELYYKIAVLTGKRKEAILSLKWSDIDFVSNYIDWNPVGRRRTTKRRPKNKIPKRLRKYLIARRKKYPDDEYVITYQGKPIKDVRKGFAAAVKEAFGGEDGDETIVPHTLRHTCATWLMQKGVDHHVAAGFLGMSVETLIRVYGHHHPDFEKGAAEAF
ncbi:Tyrosine recombinase XerC [Pseudovibrio axinellae]|uniref:Tyrosine recombinase XerC n=1 Tax=Pseudovibrio axinellae TaxID=989403 RepID=A0A165Z637_9HYPH|nr:site-specific integrase [Pseudovibrio axinellae]KZL19543.1 Tyrosine recombinase XerC [Pseudovibrio axinellae]SEQ31233.1 Site-specific recombinase XerD [Pseudovibrio axinellae]